MVLARVVLPLVLVLSGCGEDARRPPADPEQARVRATLVQLRAATERKDYDALCERVLAPQLVAQVTSIGLPCRVALEQGLGEVQEPTLTVGRIRVTGDRASAEVTTGARGQEPARDIVELARVDGRWRVTSLAGASPPTPARTVP